MIALRRGTPLTRRFDLEGGRYSEVRVTGDSAWTSTFPFEATIVPSALVG
jgi:hypothetical protein